MGDERLYGKVKQVSVELVDGSKKTFTDKDCIFFIGQTDCGPGKAWVTLSGEPSCLGLLLFETLRTFPEIYSFLKDIP